MVHPDEYFRFIDNQSIEQSGKIAVSASFYGVVMLGKPVTILPGAVIGRMPIANRTITHKPSDLFRPTVLCNDVVIGCNTVIYNGVYINERACVHDLSFVREGTEIGEDTVVGSSVVINYDCKIGARVRIFGPCHIANNTIIEDDVFFSLGAMTAVDKNVYLSRFGIEPVDFQPVVIRKKAFIGAGAILLPGVEVGEGAVVAAGSIVTKSVEPYQTVAGNPAKPMERQLPWVAADEVKRWQAQ